MDPFFTHQQWSAQTDWIPAQLEGGQSVLRDPSLFVLLFITVDLPKAGVQQVIHWPAENMGVKMLLFTMKLFLVPFPKAEVLQRTLLLSTAAVMQRFISEW